MTHEHPPKWRGDVLHPAAVARLGRLEIVARALVEGFIKGLHYSPVKGSSTEFSEHRPYARGDEVRRIDWRTFARTDRYYLKEYDDETNVRATLILDSSKSMAFPPGKLTKFRYATCLVAALGYLLLRQRDAVGLALVDSQVREFIPPKATAQHLGGVFKLLEGAEPRGATSLAQTLHQLAAHGLPRGLVVVVSDFLDEPQEILRSISHLRHRGCEVLIFHVIDPDEEEFPFTNWTIFRDPEDETTCLRLDARQVREIYRDNLHAHLETLKRGSRAAGVDYALVKTDVPFEVSLATFLDKRRRLVVRSIQ